MLNQINKSCFFIFILGCAFFFQCYGAKDRERVKHIRAPVPGGEEEAAKDKAIEKILAT